SEDIPCVADEGGSWQAGVDWQNVLPAWFSVFSATVGRSEYAQKSTTLLKRDYEHGRVKMLAVARKIATPAHRQTLPINACVSNVFGADSSRNCAVKGGERGYYRSIHPTTDNVPKMRN